MPLPRTLSLGLTLTVLLALGTTAARPASAQNLQYTLSGVKFTDGATATGFFHADPTAGTFGAFDITTTSGLTDGIVGAHYVSGSAFPINAPFFAFEFLSGTSLLVLSAGSDTRIPGTLLLQPGSFNAGNHLVNSGESINSATRLISTGQLIAAGTPVPEASTTVSFGLLLALGLGGLVIAKRKKQSA
jgi:hypothetical protein